MTEETPAHHVFSPGQVVAASVDVAECHQAAKLATFTKANAARTTVGW